MAMKRNGCLRAAMTIGLGLLSMACESVDVRQYACPWDQVGESCQPPAEEVVEQDLAGDAGGEAQEEKPWVGQPCEKDPDCGAGHTCMTREYVAGLGLDVDVPGGMCSMLLCMDDAQCGPQSTCFDATDLTGGVPIKICLLLCDELSDCRWEEGYSCYKTTSQPEEGEPVEIAACLPDAMIVAIECDDGHCEEPAGEEGR
jgi:hypothetical protein